MNCCGGNHDHENHTDGTHANKKHRGMNHILMMILCCGLPIFLLTFVPFIGRINGGVGSFIQRYAFLICPAMMIAMMATMRGGHRTKDDHEDHERFVRGIEDDR